MGNWSFIKGLLVVHRVCRGGLRKGSVVKTVEKEGGEERIHERSDLCMMMVGTLSTKLRKLDLFPGIGVFSKVGFLDHLQQNHLSAC